jgi:hypothetical protein
MADARAHYSPTIHAAITSAGAAAASIEGRRETMTAATPSQSATAQSGKHELFYQAATIATVVLLICSAAIF